ncbi:MAG: VOC family protein [Dermatophilaceae bacterium]
MSTRSSYPSGVPCWVETLQPDLTAATDFYAAVFGWDFGHDDEGTYAVARLGGHEVAGLGSATALGAADATTAWITQVRVNRVEEATRAVETAGGSVVSAPMDLPPAGRLALVRDPGGAMLGLWEAGAREGAQRVNEPGAWAMSALSTPDPAAVAPFYREVFGWERQDSGPVGLFRLPGYVGGTPEQPVPRDVVAVVVAGDTAGWAVDFWTQDARAACQRATAAGGSVLVGPHAEGGFERAVLADPGGASFSVSQLLIAGSSGDPNRA